MDKPYVAIRRFMGRLRKAWRVFREDPDEVITLTERAADGRIEYTHFPPPGYGTAKSREMALHGVNMLYKMAKHRETGELEIRTCGECGGGPITSDGKPVEWDLRPDGAWIHRGCA